MPTLHLMVGLPCSGKTTLARQIEQELEEERMKAWARQFEVPGQDELQPERPAGMM